MMNDLNSHLLYKPTRGSQNYSGSSARDAPYDNPNNSNSNETNIDNEHGTNEMRTNDDLSDNILKDKLRKLMVSCDLTIATPRMLRKRFVNFVCKLHGVTSITVDVVLSKNGEQTRMKQIH